MINAKYLLLIASVSALAATTALTGCSWAHAKQGRETGRTAAQVADDEQISARVRSDLKASPVYKFAGVGVSTFDRVVQLNGFVQSDDQKRAAEEIAKQAPGAARVLNDIVIQRPQPAQAQNTQPGAVGPTGRIISPKAQTSNDQGGS